MPFSSKENSEQLYFDAERAPIYDDKIKRIISAYNSLHDIIGAYIALCRC